MAMIEPETSGGPAAVLHALGDPSRLTILRHLLLGEHRVGELVRHLGLAQSTVSKHLACLRDLGLVEAEAQGRATAYRVTQPEAVEDVLAAAARLLELTGGGRVHVHEEAS